MRVQPSIFPQLVIRVLEMTTVLSKIPMGSGAEAIS